MGVQVVSTNYIIRYERGGVSTAFFDLGERPKESRWNDEGHGLFVQGTVLCVQRTHAPAALRRVVWSSAASLLGIIAGFYGVE